MQDTRIIDDLAAGLIELLGFLNSPRRDDILLREAGVRIDRALFPLLVRIGARGSLNIATLADQAGRDHSTVSRQLAKLRRLGYVDCENGPDDRRVRTARLTSAGEATVQAIGLARRRLMAKALRTWADDDLRTLAALNQRLVTTLTSAADARE